MVALAEERGRKRAELLDATAADLAAIQARVRRARNPLQGADQIGLAVGAVLNKRKVAKHFALEISDRDFSFRREPVHDLF